MKAEIFDKTYFEGQTSPYGQYGKTLRFKITSKVWTVFLTLLFRPKKILDVGCADGRFVKIFRMAGKEAYGADVSQYAISAATEDVKQFLRTADITDLPYNDDSFDLVYTMDVLEHIAVSDVPKALQECHRVSSKWTFHKINTGIMEWLHPDPTHITLRSISWWKNRFKEQNLPVKFIFFIPMCWIILVKKA